MKEGKYLGGAKLWSRLMIGLLLAILPFLGGNQASAEEPTPTPTPNQPAEWDTEEVEMETVPLLTGPLLQVTERPSRQNSKLDSSLNQLLEVTRREGLENGQEYAQRHDLVLRVDKVQVEIIAAQEEMVNNLIGAIGASGGEYEGHYQTLIQAMVPINMLESFAQRPDVQLVRNPVRPIPVEPVLAGVADTEGLGPANALSWHAGGVTGSGVKIGVVDGGFTNYGVLLGTDLPASVVARDYTGYGMGGSPHGTACAEIVYDMAPGATMYLSKVGSTVELANAVSDLISDNVDVISMSLGWILDGPGDGTGYLANIVADARSHGILFATAAGNDAQVSWSGLYNDSGYDTHLWASGQDINYFFGPGDGTCYNIPAGYLISVGLHWDDWTLVNQDYDLELYYWTGSSWSGVAGSWNDQAGSYPTPEEYIGVYAPVDACYGIVIRRYSATRNVCLSLAAPKMGHLDEWVETRSLTFPADSPNAMTVAAIDVGSYNLESYSSHGPTFGSGGSCSGGSTKPDIAGYANVSTVSYGAGVFNGTSAATPHVAGGAALVKQANPGYSPSQLQNYLESNALDLGSPGKDNLFGAGRLYLPYDENPPLDVYFLVDLSGSFYDDLPAFKADAPAVISTLVASNPDIRFGLGMFVDYPIHNFGDSASSDKAYERLVDLTFDTTQVLNAISGLSTFYGYDEPESQLPALYQTATGAGQDLSSVGYPGASIPAGQQANFRGEATKLILLWTDASFHRPGDPGDIPYPGYSFYETAIAINSLGKAFVLGIRSDGTGLTATTANLESRESAEVSDISASSISLDLSRIVSLTGAFAGDAGVDCNNDGVIDIPRGQPLVCDVGSAGEGVGEAVIALVEADRGPALTFLPIIMKKN